MKKILISAGLAAIGAAGLHADEYAPDLTATDANKIWNVSGTLRGFYDDNYNTTHVKQGSAGFEISPQLSLILPLQQTELGLRYTYGLYYYQQRESQGSNPIDQTHELDLWIDHAFSERLEGKVLDTFIVAQDPQLSAAPTVLPYRVEGNNIQNNATATLHAEWSMLFSTDLGYQNSFLDYQQHGATTASFIPPVPAGIPSGATYAGLLNNDGNTIFLNLNYQYLPDLSFLVGYSFGLVNYTGGEPIAFDPFSGQFYYSDSRNQYSHNIYVGGQYAITENLSLSAQVGFEYSDEYDLPSFDTQPASQFQPTANIAMTYTYLPGDYVQVGFTQSESPTYIPNAGVSTSSGDIALYQETSVLYASINHQVTPDLLASVIGHYQYSIFQGGAFDGGAQNWYSLALNLTYTINPFLSAEIGYEFDDETAGNADPSYSRNREYLGITATY